MKRWLIAAAVAGGAMAVPGTAAATVCGDDGTTQLFDSQGYYFDFSEAGTTADRNLPFATLFDSGSNGPADTPPGPVFDRDSYDSFGTLFVGGTDTSNMYFSADNDSCTAPTAGEQDFPIVDMGGLRVQRKFFVNRTGVLPGIRILNLITNPGGSPVTTTVQVGDLQSQDNASDLGSDSRTAARSSSSGDAVISPGDLWGVTNDDPTTTSDNTLAHIVDGKDGAMTANVFQLGPGTDFDPADNLIWGWSVTIPAGQTVGLMSFEVQQGSAGHPSAANAASAAAVANSYENAPLSTLVSGMSPTEVASVVNWQPSNAFTATTQGKMLLVSVTAAGTVNVSDARAALSAVSSKKRKKKRSLALRPSSASGGPPTITVPLLLTKTAKQKLRKKGKVTVNAKITFTPTGGTKVPNTNTQALTIKVKKRKHKK
jgi:hypothetical protein